MARKFDELRRGMGAERVTRNREASAVLLTAMDIARLRESRGVTQQELAERLEIVQSNISRLERRNDVLVSTLRDVVAALGGELQLIARFPDGEVRIRQFEEQGA